MVLVEVGSTPSQAPNHTTHLNKNHTTHLKNHTTHLSKSPTIHLSQNHTTLHTNHRHILNHRHTTHHRTSITPTLSPAMGRGYTGSVVGSMAVVQDMPVVGMEGSMVLAE